MTNPARSIRNPDALLWAPTATAAKDARVGFTPLQWSVIFYAPKDSLPSIRPAGRLRRFATWFAGSSTPNRLANPHLEALRRTAVLAWHNGFKVPANDLSEFLAAGFSMKQFDLMISALSALLNPNRKLAR